MERLSGLDASFLYLETPAQMMHVCGLVVIDPSTIPGGYSFATFATELAERIKPIPSFRRKLRNVPLHLDHPVWVEDEDFDIDRHLHRLALPSPGGPKELADVCAHLAGIPLDRSRPLWEMWVIEGLPEDRIAVFSKMHHATVDGVSGADYTVTRGNNVHAYHDADADTFALHDAQLVIARAYGFESWPKLKAYGGGATASMGSRKLERPRASRPMKP